VLQVRRGDDGTNVLTVRYALESLLATAGVDFPVITNGQFTLQPGVALQSFTIPLFDDTLVEAPENFRVTLTGGSPGVTFGPYRSAEVRIYDNDGPAAVDASFAPPFTGINSVGHLGLQPDERLLIGTQFGFTMDGDSLPPLQRLLPTGARDASFTMAPLPRNGLTDMQLQPDGKVLVGSDAFGPDGEPGAKSLRRLDASGACDPDFLDACNPFFTENFTGATEMIALAPDGTVALGGRFGNFLLPLGLERHFSDGRLDTNFVCHFSNVVDVVTVQPDGMILASGGGTLFRMRTNGTFDPDFHVIVGVPLHVILVQPDGRILIGGMFGEVSGQTRSNLARLHPDGTVDATFEVWIDGSVYALALDADGQLLVGGQFSSVSGVARANLARLSASGAVDPYFNSGVGPDGAVLALAPLPDGRVYVGGAFQRFDDIPLPALVRLEADRDPRFTAIDRVPGGVRLTVSAPPGRRLEVQATSDFQQWTSIATNVATNGTTQVFHSLTVPQRYFRVQEQAP
jgi:uncharacterized delta-60 repeat protein